MHITLIEPFFTGSHKQWAEGLQEHSQHKVEILSMKGRHWKWRMFGGAVSMAQKFRNQIKKTDLILTTDMLDVSTFVGLTKDITASIPVAVYFHENQLTYPWSPTDKDVRLGRNNEYAFINFTSALAADKVFFNSDYHKKSFLNALPAFLRQFPDERNLEQIAFIEKKSEVLHLGMNLKRFDTVDKYVSVDQLKIILWNHRWEYDKNPESFFRTLFRLKDEGIGFELIVIGEKYKKYPQIFDEARTRFNDNEMLSFGYLESLEDYMKSVHLADILPVTSNQDFFGGSIVEAMYCGVCPLLPNRLAYPEHLDNKEYLYENDEELYTKLKQLLLQPRHALPSFRNRVKQYDWTHIIKQYDAAFEGMLL